MDQKINEYINLNKIFQSHGYHLFLAGGTVRDYLLNKELTDMDAVTDATPKDMQSFLSDADYSFAKYGAVKLIFNNIKFDITTMREEKGYEDKRHPDDIVFVKSLKLDYKRRDFTINALYMDSTLSVIDYAGGQSDLQKRLLRMVGSPDERLKEDPLRIIRALRFAVDNDLNFESNLARAIEDNAELIKEINLNKVQEDISKIKCSDNQKIKQLFSKFNMDLMENK